MLCIPIVGPGLGDIEQQLSKAIGIADLVELRLDLFHSIELHQLQMLRERFVIPMLFSLRSEAQGGKFQGTLADRCQHLKQLILLHPELLDVQSDTPHEELLKLKQLAPKVLLLASHHDPKETPHDLEAVLETLQRMPTDRYKLATHARSAQDALRMMSLTQEFNRLGGSLTGICMGSEGAITRIFASQIGSPLIFCSLEDSLASAPGQLPWRDMLEILPNPWRTPKAERLGLIGTPIDKSPGYILHNAIFHHLGLDAIYSKMRVEPQQLPAFIQDLRKLNWKGLSVTMPLKEKLIPHLDALDESAAAMRAVNTVVVRNGKWIGYNTDGDGALDAIELQTGPVRGKRALILGAGGAAKAIAWAAKQRGAHVTIVNRTDQRAQEIAAYLGCDSIPWSELASGVKKAQLLLQSTSVGMAPLTDETLVDPLWIAPSTIVFDVVSRPKETRLLREAKMRGCPIVTGAEMFIQQAVRQVGIWFGSKFMTPDLANEYRRLILELP